MCCPGCRSCGVMESFTISFRLRVIIVFRDIIYVIIILYSWHLVICEHFWPYVWNNWSWVMHTMSTWFSHKNLVWQYLLSTSCRQIIVMRIGRSTTMQDQSRGRTRWDLYWFRPSWRVIALHPVLLYYAVEKLVAPDELRAATYIGWRTAL
jgi:hypothetical protein